MKVNVNFHSSVLIDDRIYVDPLKVDGETKADYIFITHSHWDHFSIEDIKKVITEKTIIVCPLSMKVEYEENFSNKVLFVEPGKCYRIGTMEFETFASYNVNKNFHPKQNGWVGYILKIDDQKIAVVGDSDNTPELRAIKTDILLIPIGGHYTMNIEEAVEATNAIMPKKVIPTHYGDVVGETNFGQKFKNLINENIECEIQLYDL